MLLEIAGGVLIAPFVTLLLVILLLASFGKSLGIRKAYVELLLKLFEVSRTSESLNCWSRRRIIDSNNCVTKERLKNRRKCVVIGFSRSQQAHVYKLESKSDTFNLKLESTGSGGQKRKKVPLTHFLTLDKKDLNISLIKKVHMFNSSRKHAGKRSSMENDWWVGSKDRKSLSESNFFWLIRVISNRVERGWLLVIKITISRISRLEQPWT